MLGLGAASEPRRRLGVQVKGLALVWRTTKLLERGWTIECASEAGAARLATSTSGRGLEAGALRWAAARISSVPTTRRQQGALALEAIEVEIDPATHNCMAVQVAAYLLSK